MSETVFTRQFQRPRDYGEEAMQTELRELPGVWRIYGIDAFLTCRRYYVEFRATGSNLAALKTALARLDDPPT